MYYRKYCRLEVYYTHTYKIWYFMCKYAFIMTLGFETKLVFVYPTFVDQKLIMASIMHTLAYLHMSTLMLIKNISKEVYTFQEKV